MMQIGSSFPLSDQFLDAVSLSDQTVFRKSS